MIKRFPMASKLSVLFARIGVLSLTVLSPLTACAAGFPTTLPDGSPMPGATNTGPTNVAALLPVGNGGNIVVRTAGEIIQNEYINGSLEIQAPNVTVRNCIVNGQNAADNQYCISIDGGRYDSPNCLVEDTTVLSSGPSSHAIISSAENTRILRVNCHDCGEEGFYFSASATIQGCYMYDVGWNCLGIARNPLRPGFGGQGHSECLFLEKGSEFVITGNCFDCPTYQTSTQGTDAGVTYGLPAGVVFIEPYDHGDVVGPVNISNNYMEGGGYMFYLAGQGKVTITHNILGPKEVYRGAWIYPNYIGGPWTWSNNVDLNGRLIPVPRDLPLPGAAPRRVR